MKVFKNLSMIVMLLVSVIALSMAASAGDFNKNVIDSLKVEIEDEVICPINSDAYDDGCYGLNDPVNAFDFERNSEILVEIKLSVDDYIDDFEIQGSIFGYEFNNIEPMTDAVKVFDMDPNTTYFKKLRLYLPTEVEEDNYKFRLIFSNRYGDTVVKDYNLKIDSPRHGFQIEDVVFNPGHVIQAGRALLATVRVENKGENPENSVKVSVAIPELGVGDSDFIDEVEFEDSETSEELFLRIPTCAEPGDYVALIEVRYNELREALTEETVITVVEGDACTLAGEEEESAAAPKTVISVGATSQDLVKGEAGVIFPITLSNEGKTAKTYTVSVEGTNDFASVQINPISTFVLGKDEAQATYIYLTPLDNAAEGSRIFTVTVTSADKVLKQIPLTANVVAGEDTEETAPAADWSGVKRVLEIGLIVLVVILVIIGLIIGFNKLKGDDEDWEEDEKEEGQTYY